MAVEYICDGCGKRAPATKGWNGWYKPSNEAVAEWRKGTAILERNSDMTDTTSVPPPTRPSRMDSIDQVWRDWFLYAAALEARAGEAKAWGQEMYEGVGTAQAWARQEAQRADRLEAERDELAIGVSVTAAARDIAIREREELRAENAALREALATMRTLHAGTA